MASDIVFDQEGGDSISIQGVRVIVTGRINLAHIQGAKPPADGEIGDLVMTVEDNWNPNLHIGSRTVRLWLCVPPQGDAAIAALGEATWREVQLGEAVHGG
jgi:hypothetical protein